MTNQPIKAIVACDTGVSREAVRAALPMGGAIVDVVGLVDSLEDAWAVLQDTPNDLLLIACADYSDRVRYLIEGAVKQRPERPVVVLCDGQANGFVERAFEAGADDFISLPQSSGEVMFALQKAIARKYGASLTSAIATAPLIVVVGPKGGTGKTLVSANLALGLASSQKRVAVVDLDLQFGDVGLSLGLAPERTIYDLASSGGTLDPEKVKAFMTPHSSGVHILLAPTRPDQAATVNVPFLREVYTNLRGAYDFVIVDTPPGFSPEVIATIDASSHVCMVGMLDALSLKNTKLGFETLDLMGYSRDRIRLVLNRADSRVGISQDDVVSIVGRKPDVSVPSSRDIPRAVNEGTPIVASEPKTEAARSFQALASMYLHDGDSDVVPKAAGQTRTSLLRRRRASYGSA
jgi:pilus assembly protein CpaE